MTVKGNGSSDTFGTAWAIKRHGTDVGVGMIKIDWYNMFGDRVWFGWHRKRRGTWKCVWNPDTWVKTKYNIPWHRCFKIRTFGEQDHVKTDDD
jgi:hypothetical protein